MLSRAPARRPAPRLQRGVFLLEALIGILLFSIGIVGLIGMQAVAIAYQSDAQYRIEASHLANKIISQIWLNVDRSSAVALSTSLATFAHQTGGSNCSFSGAASASSVVTDWVSSATSGSTGLPGATATMQQIVVDADAANFDRVTVTLCWRPKPNAEPRKHTLVAYVN